MPFHHKHHPHILHWHRNHGKGKDTAPSLRAVAARNNILSITANTSWILVQLCLVGALLQTFLTVLGFSPALIYAHTTVLQAANVATILLCSKWAEKGNIIKRTALVHLPFVILFIPYIPFALRADNSTLAFVLLLAVGILQQIATGLRTVCEYKLPYFSFLPEQYGRVCAIGGLIGGGFSLGITALISFFTERFGFMRVILFVFIAAIVFVLISMVCTITLKNLREMRLDAETLKREEVRVPLRDVFRHPTFLYMLPANILRGFAYGTVSVLAVVAVSLGFDETLTTSMVTMTSLATFLGCVLFAFGISRIPPARMILLGTLGMIMMPLLLIRSAPLFLILYTVIFFGRTLVDYAVPPMLIDLVPVEISGSYHAFRMAIHTGASLLATGVAIFLPVPVFLILTAVLQLLSAVSFCMAERRLKADARQAAEA